MEIRPYDQVDPAQVLSLNLLTLGFPLTPDLVDRFRRYDRRYLPEFAFYAVEADRVIGQAGLLTTLVQTAEGPARFGAAWAVCTLPHYGRQGVARALMERVEQTARELGCLAITLGTNRSWGSHRLYQSLGYDDLLAVVRAYDFRPARALEASSVIEVRKAAEAELPALEEAFRTNTAGLLGFVLRPEGFLQAAVQTEFSLDEIHGVFRAGKPVGYVLARGDREFLRVRCAVLPTDVPLPEVVDQLRALYASSYVVVSELLRAGQMTALRQSGYDVQESWGTFMLKALTPEREIGALLGLAEGRFYADSIDMT